MQPRPLAAKLPALASQRLLDSWQGLSLRFVGNVQVASVIHFDGMVCVTTACGQTFEADQVIAATGLAVDAGGIAVDTATLRSRDPRIHALGDCASIEGHAQRYIEPIARQAQAIASAILGDGTVRFAPKAVPLRIKTGSMPFTLHGVPAADGDRLIDRDGATELHMTQRRSDETIARLDATRRSVGVQ